MCGASVCQGVAIFFRWLVFGWLLTGIVFSIFTIQDCAFLKYSRTPFYESELDVSHQNTNPVESIGLFRYRDSTTNQCILYNNEDSTLTMQQFLNQEIEGEDALSSSSLNPEVLYARYGSLLAPLLSTGAFFFLCMECFFCNYCSCLVHPLIAICLILAQICQALTFLLFGNPTYCNGNVIKELIPYTRLCTISTGATYSLLAVVFYFLTGVFVLCTPKPEPICTSSSTQPPRGDGRRRGKGTTRNKHDDDDDDDDTTTTTISTISKVKDKTNTKYSKLSNNEEDVEMVTDARQQPQMSFPFSQGGAMQYPPMMMMNPSEQGGGMMMMPTMMGPDGQSYPMMMGQQQQQKDGQQYPMMMVMMPQYPMMSSGGDSAQPQPQMYPYPHGNPYLPQQQQQPQQTSTKTSTPSANLVEDEEEHAEKEEKDNDETLEDDKDTSENNHIDLLSS